MLPRESKYAAVANYINDQTWRAIAQNKTLYGVMAEQESFNYLHASLAKLAWYQVSHHKNVCQLGSSKSGYYYAIENGYDASRLTLKNDANNSSELNEIHRNIRYVRQLQALGFISHFGSSDSCNKIIFPDSSVYFTDPVHRSYFYARHMQQVDPSAQWISAMHIKELCERQDEVMFGLQLLYEEQVSQNDEIAYGNKIQAIFDHFLRLIDEGSVRSFFLIIMQALDTAKNSFFKLRPETQAALVNIARQCFKEVYQESNTAEQNIISSLVNFWTENAIFERMQMLQTSDLVKPALRALSQLDGSLIKRMLCNDRYELFNNFNCILATHANHPYKDEIMSLAIKVLKRYFIYLIDTNDVETVANEASSMLLISFNILDQPDVKLAVLERLYELTKTNIQAAMRFYEILKINTKSNLKANIQEALLLGYKFESDVNATTGQLRIVFQGGAQEKVSKVTKRLQLLLGLLKQEIADTQQAESLDYDSDEDTVTLTPTAGNSPGPVAKQLLGFMQPNKQHESPAAEVDERVTFTCLIV